MTVFFVDINHFLHFVIAAHEDSRSVVNMLWNNSNHAFHVTIDGLATSYGNTLAFFMLGEDPFAGMRPKKAHHSQRS